MLFRSSIKREVKLGISKLDLLVGSTYLEVKTPLTTLQVVYGKHIRTRKTAPFSSTERFVKHVNELAGSLQEHERAILLTVRQYEVTAPKAHQKSTHYEEVRRTMEEAVRKGLETWEANMRFSPEGVELLTYRNTTGQIL